MALTGKTIGQLTYLQYPTNDTLIPVELSGDTFHIAFSAVNYTQLTYSDLVTGANLGELSPGHYYLMTDFQTCYDQPNFDQNGDPIVTGNYKTGSTEPILLLATSTTGFSPTVFSTLYPQDKITYDINWNITEVTNSPAKGRITERIDSSNNRTDYDFRSVQFIRYHGFFSEDLYQGKVTIDSSGLVTGTDTIFSSSVVGDIIGIKTDFGGPISCFKYYQIVGITGDTLMNVTGKTIVPVVDTYYASGTNLPEHSNPIQCNVSGGTFDNYTEYYTFESGVSITNTFIGNNEDYDTFILSNNVFKTGSYRDNIFGGNSVGNTFDEDMDSNTCGPFFRYNIITNDFDDNIVGPSFQYNIIECDFRNNIIADLFQYNMIGDEDVESFDNNRIGEQFEYNYITGTDPFNNNNIGSYFALNVINGSFTNNTVIGNFELNVIRNGSIFNNFIGIDFYLNNFQNDFRNNYIVGDFHDNNIYSTLQENQFGHSCYNNTFGDPAFPFSYSFFRNNVGGLFTFNHFSGNTVSNTIGDECGSNNVASNFSYNKIGSNFQSNTIGDGFGFGVGSAQGNTIGNYFYNNTIGEYFYNNVVVDGFYSNTIVDSFQLNNVKFSLSSTDFTSATHVYGNYNCELFINFTLAQRLSYYDGSDVLTIVNINS